MGLLFKNNIAKIYRIIFLVAIFVVLGYSKQVNAVTLCTDGACGSTMSNKISYSTHVQNIGWQAKKFNGDMAGTTGRSLRLEGIKINLENSGYAGDVEYSTHIQNIGWQNYVKNGELSGTTGRSLRLEAIKIKLTGEIAEHFDVYYRVHVQNFGWLDWAKNGQCSGSAGYSYRLEGIEIQLIEKSANAPGSTSKRFIEKRISYQAHSANIGWASTVYDGKQAGTTGKNLEALKVSLKQTEYSGKVYYASYVNNVGWQDYVTSNTVSGTTGKSQSIEALKIKLDGEVSDYYDIYYRVYVSNVGWLDWARNDEVTGNVGYGNSIQAIEIKLEDKAPITRSARNIYKEDDLRIKYNSYVQSSGWQGDKDNGTTSGTTGKSKKIESVKIKLNKKTITGSVSYSTHVSNVGWKSYVSDGVQAGNPGNKIEAIKIKLTGNISNQYDIYYRVHVSNVGWMGWTSNDKIAGTTGAGLAVEAIEIELVEKGYAAPSNDGCATTKSYMEAKWTTDSSGNKYYYNIYGNMIASGSYNINGTTHYFGPTGIYLGNRNLKVIDISAHNGNVDWAKVASSGIYGVILRISAGCEREDSKLAQNIAGVKKYNIPYGIYIYSYAENYKEGQLYGDFTNRMISKYSMNPTLGVFLDLESNGITSYMGTTEYTNVVNGYLSKVPSAKVYTYKYYADTSLNTSFIRSKITWIAHYSNSCGYTGSYNMWQYTSTGRVNGVNGDVDISIKY